uniref:Uncharacterized protein n=1 Tax=Parascaris univalens TaxID=6257 RepID=A0A915C4M2_PARUN
DDKLVIFQAMGDVEYGTMCDQIYILNVADPRRISRRISTGLGSSTCSYFFPNGDALYSSTF